MFHTEWNEGLIAALHDPFDGPEHRTKRQGGQTIIFVPVHTYKERLNATVGPHGWSCAVRLEPFGGKLVATVALTILGVTKENVGDEVEVPELNERGNEKIIGAPATNSYSQAFKRACSDFGLGAYLYDEGKRNAVATGGEFRQSGNGGSQSTGNGHAYGHGTGEPARERLTEKCPKCGGSVYDNRAKKASGEYKENAPDFACKNKECGGKIWPEKEGEVADEAKELDRLAAAVELMIRDIRALDPARADGAKAYADSVLNKPGVKAAEVQKLGDTTLAVLRKLQADKREEEIAQAAVGEGDDFPF